MIKRTSACGAATAGSIADAYQLAYECDTASAFGGIVALNQDCDDETARRVSSIFVEAVVAPGVSPGALQIFAAKKKLRVLRLAGGAPSPRCALGSSRLRGPSPGCRGGPRAGW